MVYVGGAIDLECVVWEVMSRLGRQLLAWSGFGAVLVGGWALMTYTVPTREQMLKVAAC